MKKGLMLLNRVIDRQDSFNIVQEWLIIYLEQFPPVGLF